MNNNWIPYSTLVLTLLITGAARWPAQAAQAQDARAARVSETPLLSTAVVAPECLADIDTLRVLNNQGDFEGIIARGDALKEKWRKVDAQDYCAVLEALCGYLSDRVFPTKYESRRRGMQDAYAKEALANGGQLSLSQRAFFAEQLMYAPSDNPESDTGAKWPAMRRERLAICLNTYKELHSRVIALTPCELPATPDRKYFTRFVSIDGNFNPDTITDPTVKANYIEAFNRYRSYEEAARDQATLSRILLKFAGQFKVNAVAAYCYPPFNFRELRRGLDAAHIDKETHDYILKQVSRDSRDADRTFTYSAGT